MKTAVFSLLVAVGISASAQTKLDLGGQAFLRAQKIERKTNMRLSKRTQADTLSGFITLNPGYCAEDIAAIDGVEVNGGRTSILLVSFTSDAIDALEASPAVKAIQLERPVSGKLNYARKLSNIDQIHSGQGLPQAYTGRGVIAALVDGGFDPNHVNFINADGSSRIENFTNFRTTSGQVNTEVYDASYMPKITTDSPETFHGTHTMGIMAGSYRGKVTAGELYPDEKGMTASRVVEIDNPYYGVAPEASIAAAAGASTDQYVGYGISQILNYAYWKSGEEGRTVPVCLNMSLGSNVGPHDGSATLSKYIDAEVAYAEEGNAVRFIPVLSAGNEGDLPIALHKTLKEDDTDMKTCLLSTDLFGQDSKYPNALYGQIYVYSDSEEGFDIQAVVINKSRKRVALQNALSYSPEGAAKYIASSSDFVADEDTKVSPQLAANFEGYLGVMAQLDQQESGRYKAIIDIYLYNTTANKDSYCIGFIVSGKPGQRIDAYCTGEWFTFNSHGLDAEGYLNGMTDGTISDIACGRSIISVGSYNVRNYWANTDGTIAGYDYDMFSNNHVSDFSSYGTLTDGRKLPLVCAPGATVISSSNQYYLDAYGDAVQAKCSDSKRQYSWHQCVGTSMSAPVVTGSVALWMQADPTLKVADVREIIRQTAKVDSDVTCGNPTQWGAGKFDAYAGLKEVLRRQASMADIQVDEKLMVKTEGQNVEVTLAGASRLSVEVYTPSGRRVATATAQGPTAQLTLPGGLYILRANGISQKLAL